VATTGTIHGEGASAFPGQLIGGNDRPDRVLGLTSTPQELVDGNRAAGGSRKGSAGESPDQAAAPWALRVVRVVAGVHAIVPPSEFVRPDVVRSGVSVLASEAGRARGRAPHESRKPQPAGDDLTPGPLELHWPIAGFSAVRDILGW
jgi:hypothetical protein